MSNNIEQKYNKKELINSQKNIYQERNIDTNMLSSENVKTNSEHYSNDVIEDNKKIILDTLVNITVELGKSKLKIKDFLNLSKGSMLILDKLKEESLDIFVNGHLIALGEIVFLENKYGLRITSIKNSDKSINFSV